MVLYSLHAPLLDLVDRDDSIMADRGFDILEDLAPCGVRLNIPPFLRGKTQLDQREMTETRRIASLRIHVEQCMERIKNYHIFDGVMPLNLMDVANQMFFICAVLTQGGGHYISTCTSTRDRGQDLDPLIAPKIWP